MGAKPKESNKRPAAKSSLTKISSESDVSTAVAMGTSEARAAEKGKPRSKRKLPEGTFLPHLMR